MHSSLVSRVRVLLGVSVALASLLCAAGLVFSGSGCSQAPTSVPVRTFERAQRVDVICLRVFGQDSPEPLRQEACAPVPPDVNGGSLDNQLFALVTQTSRGEVAVVDLSAGALIDQKLGIPGINFLPVGALPTDIATTPDGRMAFIASAEPNKFAIYGIPGHRILGDATGRPDPEGAATLASWPVCALPQRPGVLSVVPRRAAPATDDAGAPDAGDTDAGSTASSDLPYELVAVLPGDRANSAKVVTIDPRPFLRGSPRRLESGELADDWGPGPVLAPGSLAPCPITAAIELSGSEVVPGEFTRGQTWEDGVKYVDGGVDLECEGPQRATRCGALPCKCTGTAPDGGAEAGITPDGGTCAVEAGAQTPIAYDPGPLDPPRLVAAARDDQTLFVADEGVPFIHVVDLSTPGAPRELPPYFATSLTDPSRVVSIRDLAVSPPTRDYKRFLYAVDRKEGSIMVFDATDVMTADRKPMTRPHPELNPFQPPDRIAFAAPVVSVAFARHDIPLATINGINTPNALSGLVCNPNPNIDPQTNGELDRGAHYRADNTDPKRDLGPFRLRGIFAFATLSNGQIAAIDIDDWDSPCRRPNVLAPSAGPVGDAGAPTGLVSSLAVPQPAPAPGDVDPYHAPVAPPESVTNEAFFPVSQPHRLRSGFFLRDDTRSGKHIPFLPAAPVAEASGQPLPLFGQGSEETPRIRPTALRPNEVAGTENVGVRFSFEVPDVHFDQDWTVTYEGALPGFDGLSATISTDPNAPYQALELTQPQARFCAKGVEDWETAGERANAITTALVAAQRPTHPDRLDRRMVDYVQVVDEILPSDDPYWRLSEDSLPAEQRCWDDRLQTAAARHAACSSAYGAASEQSAERDFPILEAYDDHLVIGRFFKKDELTSREIVYKDVSNAAHLKLMRCCFHHQVRFRIRTGSQWLTLGSLLGNLSHMTRGAGGRCVASCDPKEKLLNARAPSLPFGPGAFAPERDSPLAMRNPSFSFFIQNGVRNGADLVPARDTLWRFVTRGQFQALVINLAAQTTAVNPQSMRFIESLGQIAVVDGASQGLVLIDLAGVTVARAPYF